ncbi:hypothetical protein [Streptomyces sp. NPDC059788]|uniref:hypothetical protein n=1 Tax=Streptomyces sp. NPDC059788 TaxID=3346948 RepID=UPI003666404B
MTACPKPTKSRYATRTAAETAARRVAVRSNLLLSPYECVCTWWHLTKSAPEQPVDVSAAQIRDIEHLASLPDIDFREVVAADSAGDGELGRRAALRHRRNQIRWKKHLGQLIANVDAQLHERRGDRTLAAHDWARRATAHRNALQLRLTECKRLRAAGHAEEMARSDAYRRDREVAAAAGASVKELRALAGEAAIKRLIASHNAEFNEYLAEEYAHLGISLPARIEHYRRERGAT